MSYYPHSGGFPCFQGTVTGNNITNATIITPVLGEPGKKESIQQNQTVNLNDYYLLEQEQ